MAKSKRVPDTGQSSMNLVGGETFYQADKTATWRPPEMSDLPSWKGVKRLGLDTEFRDPELRDLGLGNYRSPEDHYLIGVSFAIEDGPKFYLPFGHNGGDNLPKENVIAYLKDQFATYDGDVVGANLPVELAWLWDAGVMMPRVHRFRDVLVADPLLFELHDRYRLEDVSKRWGYEGKNEAKLRAAAREYRIDSKKDMWRLPARHVGEYAEDDAEQPLKILRKMEHQIETEELGPVWDKECRLLPLLVRMRRKGVIVDVDRVAMVDDWTKREEKKAWDVVKHITGVEIPVGQSMNVELLTRALKAADLGDCIGQTDRTNKDSITKEALHGVDHPVAKAIMAARKVATLRTTFVNGTRKYLVRHGDEYRVHTTFNQIRKTEESNREDDTGDTKGVKFGRLSSAHPNLQNQPGADRLTGDNRQGCLWRSVYKPERGHIWTAKDLKQQEPKWSYHWGAVLEEQGFEGVTGALAICRALQENPLLDSYEPLVAMTGQPRPVCKIMWLSRAYGKGDGKMCHELGFDTCYVTFSFDLYRQAMDAGKGKWEAKALAVVPVDSEEGRSARASGSFQWEGAGPEGAKVIQAFDSSMPFLKVSAKMCEERADEVGYIKLYDGRRCHFKPNDPARPRPKMKKDGKSGYEWTHKAFNRKIQGDGSAQTKDIMLAVDDAGYGDYLMLQVHDELDSSCPNVQLGNDIAEVMRTAVPMRVPTVVDVERGASWGESMTVEYRDDNGKKVKHKYVWELGT